MRFNCKTREHKIEEKRQQVQSWHQWFAWHPIRLGPHECMWCEVVWRKGTWRKCLRVNSGGVYPTERIIWEYSYWKPEPAIPGRG